MLHPVLHGSGQRQRKLKTSNSNFSVLEVSKISGSVRPVVLTRLRSSRSGVHHVKKRPSSHSTLVAESFATLHLGFLQGTAHARRLFLHPLGSPPARLDSRAIGTRARLGMRARFETAKCIACLTCPSGMWQHPARIFGLCQSFSRESSPVDRCAI